MRMDRNMQKGLQNGDVIVFRRDGRAMTVLQFMQEKIDQIDATLRELHMQLEKLECKKQEISVEIGDVEREIRRLEDLKERLNG